MLSCFLVLRSDYVFSVVRVEHCLHTRSAHDGCVCVSMYLCTMDMFSPLSFRVSSWDMGRTGLDYWGIYPGRGFLSFFTPFYLLQTPIVLSWVMRLGSSETGYPWGLCSSNSTSSRRRWYTRSTSTGSCALQKRAAEGYLELQLFGTCSSNQCLQ